MFEKKIISVKNLTISYYTLHGIIKAVKDVDLDIYDRESICIVGESGSGKSTLAQAITLTMPKNAVIESGAILFDNVDILRDNSGRSKVRKEIGIVMQDPTTSFSPLFTIKDQFLDVLTNILKVTPRKALEIAKEFLKNVRVVDIDRVLNSYPHELSGGTLQRVAIALALAKKPKVLVADEPTTNLDVTTQAEVLELLRKLRDEYGLTLIMITHNFGIAAEICSRITVMYAGMIVEDGAAEKVLYEPLHPYTYGLLRAIPRLLGDKLTPIPGMPPDLKSNIKGCPFYSRCSKALTICRDISPPLTELNGKRVRCHLYGVTK